MILYIEETDHEGNTKKWEALNKNKFCQIIHKKFEQSGLNYVLYKETTKGEYLKSKWGTFEPDGDILLEDVILGNEPEWLLGVPYEEKIWVILDQVTNCEPSEFLVCATYLSKNLHRLEITDENGEILYQ